jgi:ankyrin repeat protein
MDKNNPLGVTALHLAAANGNTEIVRMLLDAVKDQKQRAVFVVAKDNYDDCTALHYAAEDDGNTEMVRMLLDVVQDREQRVKFLMTTGDTALHHAVLKRCTKTAKILCEYYQRLGIEIPQDLLPKLKTLGVLK